MYLNGIYAIHSLHRAGVSKSVWPRRHIRQNMTSHGPGRLTGSERARQCGFKNIQNASHVSYLTSWKMAKK